MANSFFKIKSKIASIKKIRKVTRAMKLVATAKLQKTKKSMQKKQDYFEITLHVIQNIFNKKNNIFKHAFKNYLNSKKKLYILITSDIGFCGNFNSSICKLLLKDFNPKYDDIITFGNKGFNFLNSREIKVLKKYDLISDDLNFNNLLIPSLSINTIFNKNQYSRIEICFNNFVNSLKFTSTKLTIFPVEEFKSIFNYKSIKKIEKPTIPLILEPSGDFLAFAIFPKYLMIMLYGAMINSKVSENAIRRKTMETATENSDEIISNLVLESNRIRQSLITQELSEIINGAQNEQ